jgi:hypothetical protein
MGWWGEAPERPRRFRNANGTLGRHDVQRRCARRAVTPVRNLLDEYCPERPAHFPRASRHREYGTRWVTARRARTAQPTMSPSQRQGFADGFRTFGSLAPPTERPLTTAQPLFSKLASAGQ